MPGLLLLNRNELDHSNEVLYNLIGQEVVKMLEVKVRGQKNCPLGPS